MFRLDHDSEWVVERLLSLSRETQVCILDSCGAGTASGLLIASVGPARPVIENDPKRALEVLETMTSDIPAVFFTLSYELGLHLNGIESRHSGDENKEPLLFAAGFDSVIVHDYSTGSTFVDGGRAACEEMIDALDHAEPMRLADALPETAVSTNLTARQYREKVDEVRELIRQGETYQVNLTQCFTADLDFPYPSQTVYSRLRNDHPSEYSAFFGRQAGDVVSISPESFFRITDPSPKGVGRLIQTAPIKGTRVKTGDPVADARLINELTASEKETAENVMIADLLRNDLGRVCEYGSVNATSLCEIVELPTLFHLVSRVDGRLRDDVTIRDVLKALFPCGSITGCPKISTMEIIDRLETGPRGLPMGAIGYSFDRSSLPGLSELHPPGGSMGICFDLSVAIRTAVISEGKIRFLAGGGIVIDSDPDAEYLESVSKAASLMRACGASRFESE